MSSTPLNFPERLLRPTPLNKAEPAWQPVVVATAYFIASLVGIAAAFFADHRKQQILWLAVATTLTLFGINRQLGLLPLIANRFRSVARQGGWYVAYRRPIQAVLLLLIAIAGYTGFLAMRWFPSMDAPERMAVVSLVFLGLFIAARVISLHEFDQWLFCRRYSLAGMQLNLVFEMTGILSAMLACAASILS